MKERNPDALLRSLGQKITEMRKKARLSQVQLAKKIGTQQSNVARMEQGRQNFRISTLYKIANIFGKKLVIEFV